MVKNGEVTEVASDTWQIPAKLFTPHDLTSCFRHKEHNSLPFVHNQSLNQHQSDECLAAAADPGDGKREIEDVADLTFGEYLRLLTHKKIWSKLGLKIDQKTFAHYLEEIRKIRNDVMHFDPEGIAPDDMKKLRSMVVFMRQLQTLGAN